jgi:Subtilase family
MARMDEWAYRYPYPVFCNPTANAGSAYEVNWQCYNALSVGNVRHTELRGYEIPVDVSSDMCDWQLSCTQTRNPPYDPAIYGGPQIRGPLTDPIRGTVYTGYSGDREMPYIVAPGITPASNGDPMTDQNPTCVDPAQCGTSLSAPTLNGIVACVLSSDSRMVNRPQAVWAVLLATAENVDGAEWNSNVDGRDGAGVVSGSSAVNFARNHSEPGPLAAAVPYAVSTANVDRSNPNGSTAKYNILIPNPKPAGKHLRVVLTWTSVPSRNPDDNYLSDMDLSVPYNGGTSVSASYNGNVEIVDIAAANLTAGATYQSVITLWSSRFPPSGGISSSLKYAIAWNWVKDHAQ